MVIEVRPATDFDELRTMLGPKRPDANVCWCLSYRIPSKENRVLVGTERGDKVQQLLEHGPLGVLAYDGDEVVGWAAVARRSDTTFATNRKIPHVDDLDVWSVWCIRVRPGHRKAGISHHVLRGAVDFARDAGAPAIEGYPVDNGGEKVDPADPLNQLFVAEGGRLIAGAASVSRRFPMAAKIRQGQLSAPP